MWGAIVYRNIYIHGVYTKYINSALHRIEQNTKFTGGEFDGTSYD